MGAVLALIASCSFALSGVMAKRGLDDGVDAVQGVFYSLVANNIVFLALLPFVGVRIFASYSFVGLVMFALAGFFGWSIARSCLYASIKHLGPSRPTQLASLDSFLLLGYDFFFGGQEVTSHAIVGILLITLGTIILIRETGGGGSKSLRPGGYAGITFGLIAAVTYSLRSVFVDQALGYWPSPVAGTMVGTQFALLTTSIFNLSRYRGQMTWKIDFLKHRNLIFSGFLSAIAVVSYFASMTYEMVSVATALKNTNPMITLIFSAFMLGKSETITPKLVFSGLLVTAGIVALT